MVDFFKFSCDACGYSVIATGKDERGELDAGMTILCEDCRELYEIEPGNAFTVKRPSHRMLRCPESFMHRIRAWTFPGPCPKCGQPIKKGAHVVSWD